MDFFDDAAMRTLHWDDPRSLAHVSWLGGWRGYDFPLHDHRGYWELVLVRRGLLEHYLQGSWKKHGPGWLTLLRAGESHALRGNEVEYMNLSLPDAVGREMLAPLRVELLTLSVHLPEERRLRLEAEIEALAVNSGEPCESAILSQILCGTVRAVLKAEPHSPPTQPLWMSQMLSRLAQADAIDASLADLRSWSGISDEHLARSMRKHLGCTPNQLLRRGRLAAAARQLSASERTVAAIAEQCGWRDLPLFHRQFRRFYGLTPGSYRARERRFIAS